jgi:hypothetical protein
MAVSPETKDPGNQCLQRPTPAHFASQCDREHDCQKTAGQKNCVTSQYGDLLSTTGIVRMCCESAAPKNANAAVRISDGRFGSGSSGVGDPAKGEDGALIFYAAFWPEI